MQNLGSSCKNVLWIGLFRGEFSLSKTCLLPVPSKRMKDEIPYTTKRSTTIPSSLQKHLSRFSCKFINCRSCLLTKSLSSCAALTTAVNNSGWILCRGGSHHHVIVKSNDQTAHQAFSECVPACLDMVGRETPVFLISLLQLFSNLWLRLLVPFIPPSNFFPVVYTCLIILSTRQCRTWTGTGHRLIGKQNRTVT